MLEMTDAQIRKCEKIMSDGQVDVSCSARCGNAATIEPDGDYECECGAGRLTSPLVKWGII